MADTETAEEKTIHTEEPKQGSTAWAKYWLQEVKDSYTTEVKKWETRGDEIIKRYRDEDSELENEEIRYEGSKYNIFWSNVQTLKPSLYSQTPQPQVARRYKDKDPVGRFASEMLERATEFSVQSETFDPPLKRARDDYLLVGRGQMWVKADPLIIEEPDIDPITGQPAIGEDGQPMMRERLVYEEVVPEYVYWKDFRHSVSRFWEEVTWVARRSYLTKKEGLKRFGEIFEDVPLGKSPEKKEDDDHADADRKKYRRKAAVWEIWDKEKRKVYWVAQNFDKLLDCQEDPLELDGFFPCPRPLYATITNDSLVPVPDYVLYQDQAQQLDDNTARLESLSIAIKAMGVYNDQFEELSRILDAETENRMIGVKDWNTMRDSGGIAGNVDFIPIDQYVSALSVLSEKREADKRDLYEITGMSDIIRGNSDPNETAAAQRIKGRFATRRLEERQDLVKQFCRDTIEIMSEIIAEHFDPQMIAMMAGAEFQADNKLFPPAVELLRNDMRRRFRIDIETDSTLKVDEEIERGKRTEFLQSTGQFLKEAVAAGQQLPMLAPLLMEMILFHVRGFGAGRTLEAGIEEALEQLKAAAAQPKPPQPDPAMAAFQAQIQIEQQKLQVQAQKAQADVQHKQAEMAQELEIKREEMAAEMALKREEMEQEYRLKIEELRQEMQIALDKIKAEIAVEQMKLENAPPPAVDNGRLKRAVFRTDENGQRVADIVDVPIAEQ